MTSIIDQLTQGAALPLNEKAELSRKLIRDALSGAKKPAIGFSGGKKSVVLLYLVRQECTIPLKVFYVRMVNEFENMARFTEKLKRLWQFNLDVESPTDGGVTADPQLCCRPPVTAGLRKLVETHAIDCLFLGNAFEDPRQIKPPAESGISCINPIFDFTDREIHDYIKTCKIPRCSLYTGGYEKLDCRRCTPAPAVRAPDSAATEDEKLIKEKLKGLGYL
jgi:3'-phosphoadenosine 5'-phosphosulfate sulfotransferase (PAPS reductase)/FAD synthetase